MIQRKQTVYLLVALVLMIVCLCMPVGRFVPNSMGTEAVMYNLWIVLNGAYDFRVWPLFAILLVSCVITIATIFSYKRRPLQSKMCDVNELLLVVWSIAMGAYSRMDMSMDMTFHVSLTAVFPFVSAILHFMAKKGIEHDEKLIRSADRIR